MKRVGKRRKQTQRLAPGNALGNGQLAIADDDAAGGGHPAEADANSPYLPVNRDGMGNERSLEEALFGVASDSSADSCDSGDTLVLGFGRPWPRAGAGGA